MGDSTQSPRAPSPPLADLAPPAPPAPAAASESEFFEAEDAAAEAPEAPAPPSPKRRGRPRKDDSGPPPPAPPPAPKAAVRRQDKRTAPADARDTATGRFTRPPSPPAKRSRTSASSFQSSVPAPGSYAPPALALARSESGRSTPGIERIFWEQRTETRDHHLTPPMLPNAMRAYLAEQRHSAEAQRRAGYVKLLRM